MELRSFDKYTHPREHHPNKDIEYFYNHATFPGKLFLL